MHFTVETYKNKLFIPKQLLRYDNSKNLLLPINHYKIVYFF